MSRRLSLLLLSTWLSVPAVAVAEDIPPEKLARIRRDEKAAMERVSKAHGAKKSSELSSEERRAIIEEQQQAIQAVMDKHGVSRKDYARQTARMGPQQNAEVDAAEKSLENKREASKAPPAGPRSAEEIPVQRGWGEGNPVMMEEKEGAPPIVEYGLPTEQTVPAEGSAAPAEGTPAPAETP